MLGCALSIEKHGITHTCCCAVRATAWFPDANEEAAICAGPINMTMLNECTIKQRI
jgi:hypothetical protein